MGESDTFKEVTKEEFYNYFTNKVFTVVPGEWFHSHYYLIGEEKVGYVATSSWSPLVEYKLKYGTCNSETINLVGSIIKQKFRG